MTLHFYFVRHGESEANLLHEFSNRDFKHPLTEKGTQQAATLAQNLKNAAEKTTFLRLFSSPLMRAVQTSETLGAALGLPVEVTDALREYDCGILEGRSDDEGWNIYNRVYNAWVLDRTWDERIEAGESFNDICNRFVPFIEKLIEDYKNRSGAIIFVGHGGTYRCMMPLIFDNIGFDFATQNHIINTGYILGELTPGGLHCVEWCGTPIAG